MHIKMQNFTSNWLEKIGKPLIFWFVLLFLISGILTLKNYGLTWDEGLGNLFFGERYLHYFTSFNEKFLDFKMELSIHHQHPLNLYLSPFRMFPHEFPAFADTLSAGTMYLFAYTLNWMNPIDGFHLFTVLLSGIFLWVLYQFAVKRMSKFSAWMAVLFLATFPRFWADMHFNPKDIPEAVFFGFVILSYWTWYEKPNIFKALLTGSLFGCALGIKANAIFTPLILLVGILPWSLQKEDWEDLLVHFRRYILHYATMAASGLALYILSWPYLYSDVFHNLRLYWSYIIKRGATAGSPAFNLDPLRQTIFSMPEWMLAMFVIGFIAVVAQALRTKSPFWRILILWVTLPIFRTSLPGTINFDGIRHFVEYVPASALIAGYGAAQATQWFNEKWGISRPLIQGIIVVLLIFNLVFINLTFYPFLHIYYNELTGGLDGARDRFLGNEASDYWASSYRQGIDWLNTNAPSNSSVHALVANWLLEISSPVLLRSDIHAIPTGKLNDFPILEASPNPTYLMFILRGAPSDEIEYCIKNKNPVYEIIVDRVPILQIYQFGGSESF
jgi:phage shock protein PspC (stress-responsive transcriptional regulator)